MLYKWHINCSTAHQHLIFAIIAISCVNIYDKNVFIEDHRSKSSIFSSVQQLQDSCRLNIITNGRYMSPLKFELFMVIYFLPVPTNMMS